MSRHPQGYNAVVFDGAILKQSGAVAGGASPAAVDYLLRLLEERGILPEDPENLDGNSALVLLAKRSWDLGRDAEVLQAILELAVDLAPARALMEHLSWSLTEPFQPADEIGLYGCAPPDMVAIALPALRRYSGPAGRSALAALPRPQHSLEARDAYDAGLCQELAADDQLWAEWSAFVDAAEWAVQNNEWLGLCADERDLLDALRGED